MVNKLFIAIILIGFGTFANAGDPTRPLLPTAKSATTNNQPGRKVAQPLTAIFIRGDTRSAIIEGKSYRVGDYYRGNRVTKIYKNKVLLRSNEGSFQLTLISKIKK